MQLNAQIEDAACIWLCHAPAAAAVSTAAATSIAADAATAESSSDGAALVAMQWD